LDSTLEDQEQVIATLSVVFDEEKNVLPPTVLEHIYRVEWDKGMERDWNEKTHYYQLKKRTRKTI